jgi:hypothetical protein
MVLLGRQSRSSLDHPKMDREEAREAARALARAERAKPEHICSLCDGGGWVCEETPISHGKGRKPVPVARLGHPALTATAPTTNRCGYRKDLNRMPTDR